MHVNFPYPPQHFISYQMEQLTFTHYISWCPYFSGLLIFSITYPHSLALRGTLALHECVWSASHSTYFTLGKNVLSTKWTGKWMG